jgi:hypothetical protein
MLAQVYSCAILGLDGVIVTVEVDTGQGVPRMVILGPKNHTVSNTFRQTCKTVPATVLTTSM